MEKKYTYGLYTEPTLDNEYADWFDDIDAALEAGRAAIRDGVKPEYVAIMKYSLDDVYGPAFEWNFYITIDADGGAWSDDWNAREEMGCIQ